MLKSHDGHRVSRQIYKAIIDLATRTHTEPIQNLMFDLLKETNDESSAAHDSLAWRRTRHEARASKEIKMTLKT